jgi:hypothetical protein
MAQAIKQTIDIKEDLISDIRAPGEKDKVGFFETILMF